MESKMKAPKLVHLTRKEQVEIDGGSQRKDSKRESWFNAIWEKLIAVGY